MNNVMLQTMMLQHTITPIPDGYRVAIWEPIPTQEQELDPFLWKVALTVATLNEAKTLVKIYRQLLDSKAD